MTSLNVRCSMPRARLIAIGPVVLLGVVASLPAGTSRPRPAA